MSRLVLLFSTVTLLFAVAPGCIVHLHGSGEAGIGLRNDNMLVMYHKAAPSAENPQGESIAETDVTPLVNNIIDLRQLKEDGESVEP